MHSEGKVCWDACRDCKNLALKVFNKREASINASLRYRHAESTWVQDVHTQSDFGLSSRKTTYCCVEDQHFLNHSLSLTCIVAYITDILKWGDMTMPKGGTVPQWLAMLPHREKVLGSISRSVMRSECGVWVLLLCCCVLWFPSTVQKHAL